MDVITYLNVSVMYQLLLLAVHNALKSIIDQNISFFSEAKLQCFILFTKIVVSGIYEGRFCAKKFGRLSLNSDNLSKQKINISFCFDSFIALSIVSRWRLFWSDETSW